MGLLIGTFKKNGSTFANAYAKVGEVNYNNNTKLATFNVEFYANQEADNLICKIEKLFVKITPGTDTVAQCYGSITAQIQKLKALIAKQQEEADLIVEGDTMKWVLEAKIDSLKKREILQLDGATAVL